MNTVFDTRHNNLKTAERLLRALMEWYNKIYFLIEFTNVRKGIDTTSLPLFLDNECKEQSVPSKPSAVENLDVFSDSYFSKVDLTKTFSEGKTNIPIYDNVQPIDLVFCFLMI